MNSLALTGIIVVQTALISYSIAVITIQRKRRITKGVLIFLILGVILDITSTTFMILGSSRGPFTLHGMLGYSSLAGMFIDSIVVWKFYIRRGKEVRVSSGIHWYSLGAYLWWIAAYITGALLVAFRY